MIETINVCGMAGSWRVWVNDELVASEPILWELLNAIANQELKAALLAYVEELEALVAKGYTVSVHTPTKGARSSGQQHEPWTAGAGSRVRASIYRGNELQPLVRAVVFEELVVEMIETKLSVACK